MASVNLQILLGNLGRDPSLDNVGGKDKVTFSLATSVKWKDKDGEKQEKTTWHNIVIWDKLANIAKEYLKKGSQVYLEGRTDNRQYEDKDGNKKYWSEVVVQRLQLLGKRERGEDSPDGLPF